MLADVAPELLRQIHTAQRTQRVVTVAPLGLSFRRRAPGPILFLQSPNPAPPHQHVEAIFPSRPAPPYFHFMSGRQETLVHVLWVYGVLCLAARPQKFPQFFNLPCAVVLE